MRPRDRYRHIIELLSLARRIRHTYCHTVGCRCVKNRHTIDCAWYENPLDKSTYGVYSGDIVFSRVRTNPIWMCTKFDLSAQMADALSEHAYGLFGVLRRYDE